MLVARGETLIYLAGCIGCHTPRQAVFSDTENLTDEQRQALSLASMDTLDLENQFLAGGRAFNLGPSGVLVAANLTPDEETGLGSWTDEEIELALREGIDKDGNRLHPLMPDYFDMAQQDIDGIIAYLRTIPAVENAIEPSGISLEDYDPGFEREGELLATAPEDPEELGAYLVDVMRCTNCHTPTDTNTGFADSTKYLGGGQAYEGPWGIVYGGNVTFHSETGLGEWTDEDVARAIREGVRIDGRRLVLMPWQNYSVLSDEDVMAVINYLRSIDELDNEIPLPAVNELYIEYVDE
jgi:mono/diheme cytochrome c family protein